MAISRLCSISGCGKKHYGNGWCVTHNNRNKKYGSPTAGSTPKGAALAFLEKAMSYQGEDCLIWPYGHNGLGYGTIKINKRTEYPHRLVCAAFNGPAPKGLEAAHSCGKGAQGCVAGKHLSWKSRIDNQSDRKEHGTHITGERIGTSKLKEADVRRIRGLAGLRYQKDIASEYGVSQSLISTIANRKRWIHTD